ncbi:MAG: GNAT family N-acetyltransferase [Dehalococcoidia bacterium]|jgi:CelD/BcsL family acetyltransferase involved in cellulose biosynthesis|nr:GNAT family N-acetyltransferase [Dehalococcoidia bacterium]
MSHMGAAGAEGIVSVRAVTSVEGVAGLADEWRQLWQACNGRRTPFLSFEWAQAWLRYVGPTHPPHVIVAELNGSPVGIVPLVLAPCRIGRCGFDVLETLGGQSCNSIALVAPGKASDVADADAIALVAPGRTREVADAVTGHLLDAFMHGGLRLRLGLVPSSAPFLEALSDSLAARAPGVRLSCRPVSTAPYVPLTAFWDDYLQSLGRRRRKVLGRAQRQLDRTFHSQDVRWLHGEEVEAGLTDLFRLHEARWAGVGIRGLFNLEASRLFHLDVAREFDRLGWLDLSALTLDGRTVSVHLAVVLDGCAYMLRSGRDPALAEFSIGHLHELRLFRAWIAAGLAEADFLRGAEPYKFYWTRTYRTYVELVATGGRGSRVVSPRVVRAWVWLAKFAAARHSPRELVAYLALRRRESRERRLMGVASGGGRHREAPRA